MTKNDMYKFKDLDIKVWYTTVYALDKLGENLNNVTFYELFNCLDRGNDVYEFLGVSDSVVRERVFIQLAFIMGVDYDYIYNQCMNKYLVSLWRGYGYTLDSMEVEANDTSEALEIAVIKGLGWTVEEGSKDFDELHSMDEYSDEREAWYYMDLSEYGKPNVYVHLENARIDEL